MREWKERFVKPHDRLNLTALSSQVLSGGKIQRPRQRADDCSSRILPCRTTNAWAFRELSRFRPRFLIGKRFRIFLRGKKFFTGQIPHLGRRGRQISAPRSVKRGVCKCERNFLAQARPPVARALYVRHLNRPAACKSKSRAKTRAVFASTIGTA